MPTEHSFIDIYSFTLLRVSFPLCIVELRLSTLNKPISDLICYTRVMPERSGGGVNLLRLDVVNQSLKLEMSESLLTRDSGKLATRLPMFRNNVTVFCVFAYRLAQIK